MLDMTIELAGQEFMLLSAGPLFTFNPSVSFNVARVTAVQNSDPWAKAGVIMSREPSMGSS
jgi:predicted 3-demethylubiquinone-9 3-methyltransferase (glyoxalase superfamily)